MGYNPAKPGRPSHAYQCDFNSCADSYFIGSARIVLDVEVQAGKHTDPSFAQPELWAFLDALSERPLFLRGDYADRRKRWLEPNNALSTGL